MQHLSLLGVSNLGSIFEKLNLGSRLDTPRSFSNSRKTISDLSSHRYRYDVANGTKQLTRIYRARQLRVFLHPFSPKLIWFLRKKTLVSTFHRLIFQLYLLS